MILDLTIQAQRTFPGVMIFSGRLDGPNGAPARVVGLQNGENPREAGARRFAHPVGGRGGGPQGRPPITEKNIDEPLDRECAPRSVRRLRPSKRRKMSKCRL